jgi:hypothetical protein
MQILPPDSISTFCQAPTLKYTECKTSNNKTREDTEEANAYSLYNK